MLSSTPQYVVCLRSQRPLHLPQLDNKNHYTSRLTVNITDYALLDVQTSFRRLSTNFYIQLYFTKHVAAENTTNETK